MTSLHLKAGDRSHAARSLSTILHWGSQNKQKSIKDNYTGPAPDSRITTPEPQLRVRPNPEGRPEEVALNSCSRVQIPVAERGNTASALLCCSVASCEVSVCVVGENSGPMGALETVRRLGGIVFISVREVELCRNAAEEGWWWKTGGWC